MTSSQASEKKLSGHNREKVFNEAFGNPNSKTEYGSTHDCILLDQNVLSLLKNNLSVLDHTVSVKGGDTLQFHLGSFPELTNMAIWKERLGRTSDGNTTSSHGMRFEDQVEILESPSFWNKYLGKGAVLCYLSGKTKETRNTWIFFNMDSVIDFITKNFKWRLLDTGRIKGDCNGKQYITYEYRTESHKQCFVLGAHGGKKGKEFIDLLVREVKHETIIK